MQQQQQQIPEGKYTSTVYRWVQQEQWQDAIALLSFQLQLSPTSRAALSLLAYCYYHTEQYESAAPLYQQLTELLPDKANYRFYHAMCLFRSGETGESALLAPDLLHPGPLHSPFLALRMSQSSRVTTCPFARVLHLTGCDCTWQTRHATQPSCAPGAGKAREVLRGVKGMDRQKSMLLANMALQDDDVKAVKSALELMDPEDSDAKASNSDNAYCYRVNACCYRVDRRRCLRISSHRGYRR